MLLFLEIFTFPSVAHTQQLELFRPAIFLQLSAAVNGVEHDAGTAIGGKPGFPPGFCPD
jgi:hypothetical protein